MTSAQIVAHSIDPRGNELVSILATFPRIILAEVNTHRMLSKNTSSSRAIPFNKMIEAISTNPFIPIAWQKDHKGMQGTKYFDKEYETNLLRDNWLEARNNAVEEAVNLNKIGLTKQLCNRLLEPFMWTTMLITGSREGWDNFFRLRCPQYHLENVPVVNEDLSLNAKTITLVGKSKKELLKQINEIDNDSYTGFKNIINKYSDLDWLKLNKGQAEIHIMDLAEKIYDAMNESTPRQLESGQWHIPFGDRITDDDLDENLHISKNLREEMSITNDEEQNKYWYRQDLLLNEARVKISTSLAARTSYTVVGNEKEINYEKMIKLHDRLIAQNPPHCFTEGTEILTKKGWIDFKEINDDSEIASVNISDLRFNGFEKPDNIIKEDYNGTVYELPQGGISISPNHILLGNIISKSSDRTKSYTDVTKIFPTNKGLNTRKIDIFREMRMFSACNPQHGEDKLSILYLTGVLYGFFIGDGSCKHKNVYFHLKKERKIKFLEDLLLSLGRTYSITDYKDGTVNFIINEDTDVFTKFYDLDGNKIIPDFLPCDNILFLNGLFEGLKNSDGSIKRNTWVYDTSSKPLHDRVLELCPLIGLTGTSYDTYDHFRIGFTTANNVLVNDSRKPNSKVIEKEYSGKLYCVEIPSKGIIVRKNGKVLITHNSSPMEHCARAMSGEEYDSFIKGELTLEKITQNFQHYKMDREDRRNIGWCRNFKGFMQYRYFVENEIKI